VQSAGLKSNDGVGDWPIEGLGASHLHPTGVKLPANAGPSKVPVDFAFEDVRLKRTLESVSVRKVKSLIYRFDQIVNFVPGALSDSPSHLLVNVWKV